MSSDSELNTLGHLLGDLFHDLAVLGYDAVCDLHMRVHSVYRQDSPATNQCSVDIQDRKLNQTWFHSASVKADGVKQEWGGLSFETVSTFFYIHFLHHASLLKMEQRLPSKSSEWK